MHTLGLNKHLAIFMPIFLHLAKGQIESKKYTHLTKKCENMGGTGIIITILPIFMVLSK